MSTKNIPVVASAMLRPFADEMTRRGQDPVDVLAEHEVTPAIVAAGDALIPAQTWYDFAQSVAQVLDEPCLGFHIGHLRTLSQLPNIEPVTLASATCGEVLVALTIDAQRILTHNTYTLSNDAELATVISSRTFRPTSPPAQIDGYFAGFMVQIFERFAGDAWDPRALKTKVCRPNAIPPDVLPRDTVKKGGSEGASFKFPARWLLTRMDRKSQHFAIRAEKLDQDFVDRLRDLLQTRIADPDMSVGQTPLLISHSLSRLQARLAANGTTYSAEFNRIKEARARDLLTTSAISIASIGMAVGYLDPTAFSRAFKSWTGLSPRDYRRQNPSRGTTRK